MAPLESLNRDCFCITLDAEELKRQFETDVETGGLSPLIAEQCPHLFATTPVFIARHHLQSMAELVRAVEEVIALPAFRERVLARARDVARFDAGGVKGAFLSFDFHLAGAQPMLIEINTNAGGALLSAALAKAQRVCCPAIARMADPVGLGALDQTFLAMFLAEWRLARGEKRLQRVAILDENPQGQYLYPEFVLFQQLFRRSGIDAVITDPSSLRLHDGVLWQGDLAIDLVYNRLTDFMLEAPAHAVLRDAYLNYAVVLTPHPRAHALYANKRNLALLSDPEGLRSMGVPNDTARILLNGIPKTEIVDPADAERLWTERRKLFFKPASGFGSKAAYRGDKLTKRVWGEILAGDYVAQALVPPGERLILEASAPQSLKFDVRNYAYAGQVQFVTSRLYQGQTTNFRTPGGGFAPVFTNVVSASADQGAGSQQ